MIDTARPIRQTRRQTLRLFAIAGGVAVVGAATVNRLLAPSTTGLLLSPPEALALAASGEAILVDIRRPDEWRRTGIADGAHPLDMRRDDFTEALLRLVEGDAGRPITLICAGGVRSRHLADRLDAAGFTHIYDVPEGMMGSRAGPGWIARGLPLVQIDTE